MKLSLRLQSSLRCPAHSGLGISRVSWAPRQAASSTVERAPLRSNMQVICDSRAQLDRRVREPIRESESKLRMSDDSLRPERVRGGESDKKVLRIRTVRLSNGADATWWVQPNKSSCVCSEDRVGIKQRHQRRRRWTRPMRASSPSTLGAGTTVPIE